MRIINALCIISYEILSVLFENIVPDDIIKV